MEDLTPFKPLIANKVVGFNENQVEAIIDDLAVLYAWIIQIEDKS